MATANDAPRNHDQDLPRRRGELIDDERDKTPEDDRTPERDKAPDTPPTEPQPVPVQDPPPTPGPPGPYVVNNE
jgi:hypothetical protein